MLKAGKAQAIPWIFAARTITEVVFLILAPPNDRLA